MRTTIVVDDELGKRFREAARERGMSLSRFLVEAGRAALVRQSVPAKPFTLITRDGDGVVRGVDLDRTGELLVAEDQQQFGSTE